MSMIMANPPRLRASPAVSLRGMTIRCKRSPRGAVNPPPSALGSKKPRPSPAGACCADVARGLFGGFLHRRQLEAVHRQFDGLVPALLADVEMHFIGAEIFQVDADHLLARFARRPRLAVLHRHWFDTSRLEFLLAGVDVVDLEADMVDAAQVGG